MVRGSAVGGISGRSQQRNQVICYLTDLFDIKEVGLYQRSRKRSKVEIDYLHRPRER